MNMDDLMAEIDGAWPKGMPPEQLDVVVSTEDQVLLDIKGLTLQMINNRETVVIEFEPVNFDDITVEQLDQMAEFIQKKRDKIKPPLPDDVVQELREEAEDDEKAQQEMEEADKKIKVKS
jgi:hypothetical protein